MKNKIKLITIATSLLLLTACAEYIPSYTVVNNTGSEWLEGEVRTIPNQDVTPNVKLPDSAGGAVIPIPPSVINGTK